MTPGFHLESVATDLVGTPSHEAALGASRLWSLDPVLSTGTLAAVTPLSPRHLWISLLRAGTPGRGHGAALVDLLCSVCDARDVVLELRSLAVDGPPSARFGGLPQEALDSFYARRGFAAVDGTRQSREPAPSVALRDMGACLGHPERATFAP